MAVDVCNCNEIPSLVSSPRISFSYDLNQTDHVFPLRSDSFLLSSSSSSIDFDFCIVAQQISSADELFSNGKILPTQIKKIQETHRPKHEPSSKNINEDAKKKRLKEFLFDTNDDGEEDEEEEKPTSKSFWKFTRSTSLNFDSGKGKGLLRKLQKLSRSNSTGSAPIPKQMMPPKVLEKQNSQKQQQQPEFMRSNSSSVASSNANAYYYTYNSSKRPPLKKNCRGYGNGIRITPVLNIPPAYGSMGLFGLGSLFCNGKDKKKKK